jgi:hypothetical protein
LGRREAVATTKDMAIAAAAGLRGGPSPLEPTFASATETGCETAATTKNTATVGALGWQGGLAKCDEHEFSLIYTPHLQRKQAGALRMGTDGACSPLFCAAKRSGALFSEHAGWAEGSCVPSRRFHEAVLQVIASPSWCPALCHHWRSGYQPFSPVPNPDGVVGCTV